MSNLRVVVASVSLSLLGAGCFNPNEPAGEGDASASADDSGSSGSSSVTVGDTDTAETAGTVDDTIDPDDTTEPDSSSDPSATGETDADTTPPTVVSISPETGAMGVSSDAMVVVTFSEPMDRIATQAAWQTPDIGDAVMMWNDDDTELTVVPNEPLEYASGDDVDSLPALEYTFTIDTTATDKAGNALEEPVMSNFYTWRLIEVELERLDSLTGMAYAAGSNLNLNDCYVGDVQGDTQQKGLMSFTLPALPAEAESIVAATVSAEQVIVSGSPYGALPALGDMHILHVEFATGFDAFAAPVLEDLGIFSDDATLETKSFDVAAAVADDYAEGRANSQYRLEFPVATNGNGATDRSTMSKQTVAMSLTYRIE